jgi:glycerol-3-phosphate cytidylyltransferase
MPIYQKGVIAGNFDLIHPGYVHMFNECKDYCEHLTVCLHEDPSVERPEKHKPLFSVEERTVVLSALRPVDQIVVYRTEKELESTLAQLAPDVRFLGDDYLNKYYTGEYLKIPIVFITRSHGWSTTKLKNLIKSS